MPNWTSNTIRVEGDEADLRAFIEAVKWQDQIFDFNRIIPMPPLLRNTASGFNTINGKKVRAWYVANPDALVPGEEGARRFTPDEEAALKDIGYFNWYDWSIAKWGTKWSACHAKLDANRIADGSIEITFDTAWDPPLPLLRRMFEMFPRLSFLCSWQNEGEDFSHSIEHHVNGEGDAS